MTPEEKRILNQISMNRVHLKKYERMKQHCTNEIAKITERNVELEKALHELQRKRLGAVKAKEEGQKRQTKRSYNIKELARILGISYEDAELVRNRLLL